jgi:DNA-binding winged helix-turn-helix (wHTH) protein
VSLSRPQDALKNFSEFSQGGSRLIQREIYAFGPYSLDSAQMILRREKSVVQMQPRALKILLVLVTRHGEVVSKQELMNAVWPDSFVEEGNLTQNIFVLRRELGKTADGEDYIQTVSKRGYRMNVPVEDGGRSDSAESAAVGIIEPETEIRSGADAGSVLPSTLGAGQTRRKWLVAVWPVLAMLMILVIAIGALGFWRVESAQPRVSGYVQITRDGAIKRGSSSKVGGVGASLLSDGNRIYFTEGSSDYPFLAEVSAAGGETARIAAPVDQPQLLDVSRQRSEFAGCGGD